MLLIKCLYSCFWLFWYIYEDREDPVSLQINFINFIKMAVLESWTLSDDNFFNSSFENKEQITPEALGHGLDP
jgi:hypothetical protein